MADVVGLDGKQVSSVIPRDDQPEDVLNKLLCQIKDGSLKPTRLIVVVEGDLVGSPNGYFIRSSLAINAEALTLLALGQRILEDEILDI